MVETWQYPDTPPLGAVYRVKLCALVNTKRKREREGGGGGGTGEIISCLAVRGGAGRGKLVTSL